MRFAFVAEHASQHPVVSLCRVLGVSRSGYYDWRTDRGAMHDTSDVELSRRIAEIHRKSRKRYGSPRITRELRRQGIRCNRKRVVRLMRREQIRAKTKRRFIVTTRTDRWQAIAPDLVGQQFSTREPNRVWTSDITYVWTREGWCYLAVILDLYARRVVGWELGNRLTSELVTRALERAARWRKPEPGLIFHSDRGSQYGSDCVRDLINRYQMRQSMSAKGNCYDNAVTESFFHTLKTELTYFERYETRGQARQSIFEYIEVFYNRERLHSTNAYTTPSEYEDEYFST